MTARTGVVLDQLVDVALAANAATEREDVEHHMEQFASQVRLSGGRRRIALQVVGH